MTSKKNVYSLMMMMMIFTIVVFILIPNIKSNAQTFKQISFEEHQIGSNFYRAQPIVVVDLDRDEDLDVIGAAADYGSFLDNAIAWWENDGNENFSVSIVVENFYDAHGVYATDLDEDGDIDVLGAARGGNTIAWWENDGAERFTMHFISKNFDGANAVSATDIDNDGDQDILGAASNLGAIAWWENDGEENFVERLITTDFDGAYSIYNIDIDDDGDQDILSAAYYADVIAWWQNDGNGVFTLHTIDNFDGARWIHAADLDQDGDVDVLGAGYFAQSIAWWENDGHENFTLHNICSSLYSARYVNTADIDNDGDLDVVGAADFMQTVVWWENDGSEQFMEHIITTDFDGASSAFPVDLDQDGDIDIVGSAQNDHLIVWWEQLGIPNQAPEADAGGPYVVSEGNSVLVTATGYDPEGQPLIFEWDLNNDNVFEAQGQSVTFSAFELLAPDEYHITVKITDSGGLAALDQSTVQIIYNFDGFFPPVDNIPTQNQVNAGRAIPVKFSLSGDRGLNIFEQSYPKSQGIICDTGLPISLIDETVTAGNSELTYDAVNDIYVYVWKTDKAWSGTCRQIIIKFNDGTYQLANFKFE